MSAPVAGPPPIAHRRRFARVADLRRADLLRRLLPAAALRDGRQLAEAAGRDPAGQHAGAAAARSRSSPGSAPGARRRSACSRRACRPYFLNSFLMVVPAVVDLDADRRPQRLRADQVAASAATASSSALMLFACFIPFQIVLIPMAQHARACSASPARPVGLDARPRRLRPRLHHAVLPQLLRGLPDRAGARRA